MNMTEYGLNFCPFNVEDIGEKVIYFPYRTAWVEAFITIKPTGVDWINFSKEIIQKATKKYSKKDKKIIDYTEKKPSLCDNHSCVAIGDIGIMFYDGEIHVGKKPTLCN